MKFSFILSLLFCCLISVITSTGCAPPEIKESTPKKSKPTKTVDKQQPETMDVSKEAKVGVGKKGHSYGGDPITEPASQYWRLKEKIAFDIQIPNNMKLFKATNGKGPKSHEEFMKKIIEEGQVELPDLPEGLNYEYDVESETLMVVGKVQKTE